MIDVLKSYLEFKELHSRCTGSVILPQRKSAQSVDEISEDNPQMNADERRFVNLNIQCFSKVCQGNGLKKSPQGTQRAQNSAIPVTMYEKVAASRFRTRMTRIARIFTDIFDRCASVFHPLNKKPLRAQRTQSRIANLCALCVLCGGLTLFTAKDANGEME